MLAFLRRSVLALATLLGAACATGRPADRQPAPSDHDIITSEQLREHQFNSVYDAVLALHSNWMRTRGSDSFISPTQVQVYVDGTRFGGVESLRSLPVGSVNYVEHFDGLTASARWGLDHGQGVIFVSTKPPPVERPPSRPPRSFAP